MTIMASKKSEKNITTSKGPTRQMRRRSIFVMVVLIGFCFSALIGRLSYIQVVQADSWRTEAISQQLSDYETSAARGSIYDTNGEVLAQSSTVWTIVISPKDLIDEENEVKTEKRREKLSSDLSEMLSLNKDELYAATLKVDSQYEVIKSKIGYQEMEKVSEWIEKNSKEFGISVRAVEDYKRYYPEGNLLSNVMGFTGTENTGLYGLEAEYEETLSGVPGRIVTMLNGVGNKMSADMGYEKTIEAKPGNDLILTIDKNVQYYVEKHLEEGADNAKTRNRASAIVMDVNTGEIIAMATKGDFDPNEPMVITDPKVVDLLNTFEGKEKEEATLKARENQWMNKSVTFAYDPGSVFKIFTASMALEEGLFNETSPFHCSGFKNVGDHKINCHVTSGHGSLNFAKAVYNSCNPAFITIGHALGAEKFAKYHKAFGFTDRTGIDVQGEIILDKKLYFDETMSVTDLAVASFGQNFKVTPLQMVTALSAVANGGKLLEPYVVKQVQDSEGNVIETTNTTVKRQVISEETSKRMTQILADTVIKGGSKNAYVSGYRMAGKTGTSEKKDEVKSGENGKVVASFAGFAPADNPKYAIIVMMDEPDLPSLQRFGSMLAAPVVQKIMEDILPYLGVEPQYTEQEISNMESTTPNVIGKSVAAAKEQLDKSDLKCKVLGEGKTVVKQVPDKGASIPRGGIVVLYTDKEAKQTTTVPDFTGKSLPEVKNLATEYNLNIQLDGLDSQESKMRSISQSINKGTKVNLGTTIKITFVYEDSTA